jgi:hypothetical protein
MKPKMGAPQLYEYHTPGEYAGGEEDYDGLVAPSEYFATDEKVCLYIHAAYMQHTYFMIVHKYYFM